MWGLRKGLKIMGLDMYSYSVEKGIITEDVDFVLPEGTNEEGVHYWRKHPNLHGWMENLYYEKGGKSDTFNCVSVRLTLEDLDQLEDDIMNENLPSTFGFFFGESDGSEKEDDLDFVSEARRRIENGKDVYYSSWW